MLLVFVLVFAIVFVFILFVQIVYSILGINKRNLAYIKKLNPQKNIRLADNKHKTKQFLEQRGIPVPKTYAYITDRKQLLNFDFGSLPSNVFVAKPNKGSKGKGVFILQRTDQKPPTGNPTLIDKIFSTIEDYLHRDIAHYPYGYLYRGTILSDRDLKKKLVAILEGNYTLANRVDSVLVEEKILPGAGFEQFCAYGLADIRVIVCNLVPVAAMLRMPTKLSGGVANLAQGGMALGIDIPTGQIRTLAIGGSVYYGNFPDAYKHLYKFVIPFWDDILLYSSNIQYFVNMGYIGIDWVITPDGPKLLEVNGKAGLEIQNISGIALEKSLDKINDLDIPTPQKGVEVAKSLFTPTKDTSVPQSKVLYLSQRGILSMSDGDSFHKETDVVVVTKPSKLRNYTSLALIDDIKKSKHTYIKVGNAIIKDISLYGSDRIHGHRIELGNQTLKNYYIRPIHKSHANISFISPKNILDSELDELMILDKKIQDISKQLSLLRLLSPTNYLDMFDKFISHKGKFNPVFSYHFPSLKQLTLLQTQLQQLRDEHKGSRALQSNFAQLFYDKFVDIQDRISLVQAYKKQDHDAIFKYNSILFGSIDEKQVLLSQNMMHKPIDSLMYHHSQKIHSVRMREVIDSVFAAYGIKKYIVDIYPSLSGRISFINKHIPTIRINPKAKRFLRELQGQLEHEIGVHMQRAKNGAQHKWLILQKGTAGYLLDEEGLAIYKAEKYVQQQFPHYYNHVIHKKYVLTHMSEQLGFSDFVAFIKDLDPSRNVASLFKTAVRFKRGMINTSLAGHGNTFFKDKLYLDGYKKISTWVDHGGDIDTLMIGKIKIEDLVCI